MKFVGKIKVKSNEIIKITKDDNEVIEVENLPTLKEVKEGDLITGTLKVRKGRNLFARQPFVTTELGDEKTVVGTFIGIYSYFNTERKKYMMSIPIPNLYTLYRRLLKFAIGQKINGVVCESVSQFLTMRAMEAWGGDRRLSAANLAAEISIEEFGVPQITKLLVGWFRKHDRRLLMLLGIDYKQIDTFYEYPGTIYNKLLNNPYNVSGISQKQARDIAKTIGKYEEYDTKDKLIGMFLRELREESIGSGSTCVKAKQFFEDNDEYELKDLMLEGGYIVEDKKRLYLKEIYHIESSVANYLVDLIKADPLAHIEDFDILCQPDEDGHFLDAEQIAAIKSALINNVSIITGQAGTGKTSCIKFLLRILEKSATKFVCVSFTGKAANRMEECTSVHASTVHMMLATPEQFDFVHVIWDEFSMTDMHLFYKLIRTFSNRIRITIIGDPNQLPPIGWGNIFKQLIISECVPVVKLRTIHRVRTKDGDIDRIIENSRRIIYWKDEIFDFVEGDNFKVSEGSLQSVINLLVKYRNDKQDLKKFIVITPYRNPVKDDNGNPAGIAAIESLNRAAQIIFNHKNPYVAFEGGKWRYYDSLKIVPKMDLITPKKCFHVGDKVMMRHNNYEIKIYNGTEGIIEGVDSESLTVNFNRLTREEFPIWVKNCWKPKFVGEPEPLYSDKIFKILLAGKYNPNHANSDAPSAEYPDAGKNDSSDLSLSFCITVHQSQGSQWDEVTYFIDGDREVEGSTFLIKELTYVAITRACCKVHIISSNDGAAKSVLNRPKDTMEMLCERLRDKLPRDYPIAEDDAMERELALRIDTNQSAFQDQYGGYDCDTDEEYDSGGYDEEDDE